VLSALIAAASIATYASGSLQRLAAEDSGLASVYASAPAAVQTALYVHIAGGSLALLLGPWQFSRRLRTRFTRAHRVSGRIYLGAVWIGSLASLVILPYNSAGWVGVAGFGALAVLWSYTGYRAVRAARGRRLEEHRAWMIRNYSLSFAAVMLRTWTPLIAVGYASVTGADADAAFSFAYHLAPFLCWVPNLLVAEVIIRARNLPSPLTKGS